jgi:hypothetical protein
MQTTAIHRPQSSRCARRARVCLVVVMISMGGATGIAGATTRTSVAIYQAFGPHGAAKLLTRPKSGYCWVGSLTTPRRNAWRCTTGNYLHDPCFSSAYVSGIVLCPDAPWLKTGVKIRLTRTLPYAHGNHSAPSVRAEPWALELYGGRRCLFSSGASNVVRGKRLNYFCGASSQEGLWGFPYRGSEPWTILIAPFQASTLSERAAVRRAWM